MNETERALDAMTVGPNDRLVLVWTADPPEPEHIQSVVDAAGLTGRVISAVDVQAVVIRATRAEGSTVGQCGDVYEHGFHNVDTGLRSARRLTCWLAHGHTGMHSDGEASWKTA